MAYWYFAFGSNLSMEQMENRVSKWQDSKKAFLKYYKLTFNKFSNRWNGGVADIVKDSKEKTHGVIYSISKEQLDIMDGFEVGYKQIPITVECENKSLQAITYTVINKDKFYPPSEKYIRTILGGLVNHDFTKEIISEVETKIYSMISNNK